MKNLYIIVLAGLLLGSVVLWSVVEDEHAGHDHAKVEEVVEDTQKEHDHSEHEGEEHTELEETHTESVDLHEGHDHAEPVVETAVVEVEVEEKVEENHDGHGHEEGEEEEGGMDIKLSTEAVKLAEIKMEKVIKAKLAKTIEMSGEVGFNEDRVANITPRYAGIAKQVKKHLGEYVQEGDVLAVVEGNESLTAYNIIAPISGHIIEKNITIGEFLGEEEAIYVIADMKTVWVNCEVYPNTAQHLAKGQQVKINAVGLELQTVGKISYIAPIFSKETRSAVARIEISSENMKWRPGMFVYASLEKTSDKKVPVVKKDAVQVLNDKNVIFVQEANNVFEPVEVTLGMSDDNYVEIKSGIHLGDSYVSTGAFELKAKLVTSALGDHAGHGH